MLVSAALLGVQAEYALQLVETGKLNLFLSVSILKETDEKLAEKFFWPADDRREFLDYLEPMYKLVDPALIVGSKLRDPTDLHVLGAAVSADAQLIVTSDPDLLVLKRFKQVGIIHPKTLRWTFPK